MNSYIDTEISEKFPFKTFGLNRLSNIADNSIIIDKLFAELNRNNGFGAVKYYEAPESKRKRNYESFSKNHNILVKGETDICDFNFLGTISDSNSHTYLFT